MPCTVVIALKCAMPIKVLVKQRICFLFLPALRKIHERTPLIFLGWLSISYWPFIIVLGKQSFITTRT